MTVYWGGSVEVKILSDAGGIPGSVLHSTQSYGVASSQPAFSVGWVTFPNHDAVLDPGTYWLSLEPVAGSGFEGVMPGGAPNPLDNYAFFIDGNNRWVNYGLSGPQPGLGIRIRGTVTAAPTPEEQIADLQEAVTTIGLSHGIATGLDAKLRAALAALAAGDTPGACSALQGLINQANTQAGKHIPAADAATLIAEATAIRTALGC